MEKAETSMSRTQFPPQAAVGSGPHQLSEHKQENNRSSPELEAIENMSLTQTDTPMGNTNPAPGLGTGGPGIQQPKVQTAFIHKLYNMLEDQTIQHLISWSASNESFVVSPTNEFSKALSLYFKHTNISSFVRQLNMYGFHKVNDVFHNGSPDSALWEFKHGNGNFRRGDLIGLREIKRRASRHALIHRDSFSGPKSGAASSPGTPGEHTTDSIEGRLVNLEHSLFDFSNRLARSEEHNSVLTHRFQTAMEGLARCHQFTLDLSHFVTNLCPRDSPVHREIQMLQKEIERHQRLLEESPDMLLRERQPYVNPQVDSVPLSPRQRPIEEESRPSYLSPPSRGQFRPPPPPMSLTPRRYGSFGGPPSPNSGRPQPAHPPPIHQPLPSFSSPPSHLSRRHTAADIRVHGWRPEVSPFHPSNSSSHWPPSPNRTPNAPDDATRQTLAAYEINKRPSLFNNQSTPPLPEEPRGPLAENGWSFATAKYPSRENQPPTRRCSIASSSVHALLNPSDSNGDDYDVNNEDRKRKRIQ